jgi:hypothetical protein
MNVRMSRSALVVGALLLLLAAAPAAEATYTKDIQVSVTGSAVAGKSAAFAVKITNPAGNWKVVGSANVTTPFQLVSPAGYGGTVKLRELWLKPGKSLTTTITATVPCGYAGPGKWDVDVKSSGSFHGDELPITGNRTTPVSGQCGLAFGTPPADAETATRITGAPFDAAGPPVTVAVVDGSGVPVTSAAVPITVSLAPGSGLGPLTGTTTQVTSGGVATFADLRIGSPGLYALKAAGPGLAPVYSAFFNVDTAGVACVENVTCTVSAATGPSTLTLTAAGNPQADAGVLRLSFDVGLALDCAGYTELTAGTAVFEMTGGREKLATLQIDKHQMKAVPSNGASHLQLCFAAPEPFPTRSGTAVRDGTFDWDGDGVAEPVYEGLLGDCGHKAGPPCVSKRKKTGSGDGVIEAKLPAGDPGMRG